MANEDLKQRFSIDPKSGFCSKTKIYHSLRPQAPLPDPETTHISVTDYVFSLLKSHPPPPRSFCLIDATTGRRIRFEEFRLLVKTLAFSLHTKLGLSNGDSALVLSPNSIHIPILYFALFFLGVVISPSNPSNTETEIYRQIELSRPVIAFATSDTVHKVPPLRYATVLLDSPEFYSLMTGRIVGVMDRVEVRQSDTAAILYSSGTTGTVKGVALTHRNWMALVAGAHAVRPVRREAPAVALCKVPYFHVYGFGYLVRALAMGETLVTVAAGRFDLKVMLRTIDEFRITHVALAPPVALVMVRDQNVTGGYDLSSLEVVACGGAPLLKSIVRKFRERFPKVQLAQAYGLTESTGRVFGTVGPKECQVEGATGKLLSNCEAKIVDPHTSIGLSPGKPGEVWLRGSFTMKGYVGDEEATAAILDSEGWLRTGDLCYIDSEAFLFFVDRIKEIIKYKAYLVVPAELEHLLQSHPDVLDAAVVPYPDEEVGQVPMAFVVRRLGSTLDELQIKDFIAKQVAPYKRVRRVMFINSIPKNAPGKVLRKDLIKLTVSTAASKL